MATAEHIGTQGTSREVFALNGAYHASSSTTSIDLKNDIDCWLETIHATVDLVIDGLSEEGGQIAANPRMVARTLYGVLYQIQMVQGALAVAHGLQEKANRSIDGRTPA